MTTGSLDHVIKIFHKHVKDQCVFKIGAYRGSEYLGYRHWPFPYKIWEEL